MSKWAPRCFIGGSERRVCALFSMFWQCQKQMKKGPKKVLHGAPLTEGGEGQRWNLSLPSLPAGV